MPIGTIICIIVLSTLIYISYKDIKERIIPNWTVLVILCMSAVWYFIYRGDVKEYFFYIFLMSMPLLLLSFMVDSFFDIKANIYGYAVIIFSIAAAVAIPADFKTRYIAACLIILLLIILEGIIKRNKDESEEDDSSIGGGDIKLLAVLGPFIGMNAVNFLFVTFLSAFIYMKIKKEKTIYLAPFMFLGYIVILLIN